MEKEPIHCFYCDVTLFSGKRKGKKKIEYDHFPIGQRHGGEDTVPSCTSCHDMKDRFKIEDWSLPWITKIVRDFPLLSRETRIFLAKAIDLMSDVKNRKDSDINF